MNPSYPIEHDPALGAALLIRARNAIARPLGLPGRLEPMHPALATHCASSVVLYLHGARRGSRGRVFADRSLEEDVRANAVGAAFDDHRYGPLTAEEFPAVRIVVDVIGMLDAAPARTERAALRALHPGGDGVALSWAGRHAHFGPEMWQTLPDAARFLRALKMEAGLQTDFWSPEVSLARYRIFRFEEAEHDALGYAARFSTAACDPSCRPSAPPGNPISNSSAPSSGNWPNTSS